MNKNIKISEIMSKNVFTVDINDTVNKADEIFKVEQIHNLPVLEGDKFVGIIFKSKLEEYKLRHLYDFNEKEEEIEVNRISEYENLINRNLHFLYPEDTIQKAVELMAKYRYECLPVVDWDKHLIGILSYYDILLYLNKYFKEGNIIS
jgi:CBS domain-containing protein